MASVTVTQTRSANGISPSQRDTLRSLKLGRIGKSAEHKESPELAGKLRHVAHLVDVTPADGKDS